MEREEIKTKLYEKLTKYDDGKLGTNEFIREILGLFEVSKPLTVKGIVGLIYKKTDSGDDNTWLDSDKFYEVDQSIYNEMQSTCQTVSPITEEEIIDILDENQSKFMGTNEANLHSAHEIKSRLQSDALVFSNFLHKNGFTPCGIGDVPQWKKIFEEEMLTSDNYKPKYYTAEQLLTSPEFKEYVKQLKK